MSLLKTIITLVILIIMVSILKANPIEPEMILIKSGTFQMGLKSKEKTVIIVRDFYIGKYEITNEEYNQYDPGHKGSWSNSDYPVENISWDDAVDYCKWLSKGTGRNYKLPTEAEWEYACRAGSKSDYYWGEDMNQETYNSPGIGNYAWYCENSDCQLHSVGQKHPNSWGLYDMAGNVWEWCSDWYNISRSGHVVRGGSCDSYGDGCQSGFRVIGTGGNRFGYVGFRVVRSVN